jgi:hypothetical protein
MRFVRPIVPILAASLLSGAGGLAAGTDTGVVEARAAAGVSEVGRPLDVLRDRAERQARQRAEAALVDVLERLVKDGQRHHTARDVSSTIRDEASWDVRYWSNGSVTARVAVPRDAVSGGGPSVD